jgi:hypothetical protein
MSSIQGLLNENITPSPFDTTLIGVPPQDLQYFPYYNHRDDFSVEYGHHSSSDSTPSPSISPYESSGLYSFSDDHPRIPSLPPLSDSPTPPPSHLILSTMPIARSTPIQTPNESATNTAPSRRPRTKFSSADLKAIMEAVVDVKPYLAKHGEKGPKWKEVAEKVKARGYCQLQAETTIKKKVDLLLAYHEVSFSLSV